MRIFATAAAAFWVVLIFGQSFECRAGGTADAREILNQAVRVMASPQYLGSKSEPLMLIVGLLAKADDLEGALNMTAGLQQAHYERIKLYGKIAETRADMGDMDGVNKVLDLIQADADYIASKNPGLPRGIYKAGVLKNIVFAQARAGNVKVAQEAYSLIEFESLGRDSITEKLHALNEIATAQARKKDVKAALKTAEEIQPAYRSRILADIALSLAQTGDTKGALDIAAMIPPTVFKVDALVVIVKALAQAGALTEARKIVENDFQVFSAVTNESARKSLQEYTQRQLADAQAMVGDSKGAVLTATALSDKPNSLVGSPKDQALQKIAEAQAEAKDKKGSLETAATIQDSKIKNLALKGIASRLAKAGDVGGALEAVGAIQHSYSKAEAIAAIAILPAVAANITAVYPMIETIQREGDKAVALQAVVEVLANAGDVKGAMRIGSGIQTENYRSNVLNRIAVAQAKAGDVLPALQTVRGIGGERMYHTLQEIARVQSETGDTKGALSWANNLMPREKVFALIGVAEGILQRQKK